MLKLAEESNKLENLELYLYQTHEGKSRKPLPTDPHLSAYRKMFTNIR